MNVEETKDGLLELTAYPSKEDDIENIDLVCYTFIQYEFYVFKFTIYPSEHYEI